VTPPLDAPCMYLVVASAKADFSTGGNRIPGAKVIVSNLVLVVKATEPSGPAEALALSGETGKAASAPRVSRDRDDGQARHHALRPEQPEGRLGSRHDERVRLGSR